MPDTTFQHHAALNVEYDGTPYKGWTRQPDGMRTIQGDLIDAFHALGCSEVALQCAGRTDAGVHAVAQVIDARYHGRIEPERLARALNDHLAKELRIIESNAAIPGFDARRDATSRAYEYRVLNRSSSSPLRARRVLHHPRRLDRDVLDRAAAAVIGQHDFAAFTPSRTEHVFFHRTIVTSAWIDRDDELVYCIRGNAFLRHMVRVLVGTMLAAARGEIELEEFTALLSGAARREAAATALPHALCLVDVTWEPVEGLPLPPRWRAGRS